MAFPLMQTWTRSEKIGAIALIVSLAGAIASWLVIPGFQNLLQNGIRLDNNKDLHLEHKVDPSTIIISKSQKFKCSQVEDSMYREKYEIIIPIGGTYDTGIWVQSPIASNIKMLVECYSKHGKHKQPFYLILSDRRIKSLISITGDVFVSALYVVQRSSDDDGKHNIYLSNPNKIYLSSGDGAIGDLINLEIIIDKIPF